MTDTVIKELIYEPSGDTLQLWLVEGPIEGTFNKPFDDDGMYSIVRVDEPTEVVGWEIVGFQHYASVHSPWRTLANQLKALPGGSLVLREPSQGVGLQQLIPA
ncbi:MAG TPA: hypothetical protein VM070_00760 [Candidatus Saccharimonadales bacterium]|nr:hypothetical protein [Candidatus Saccharimonadales bacterium]